jgi:hypothetical protein
MPTNRYFLALAALICCGAQLASAQDVSSTKDLLATIVLNGQSCDQVVDSKRNADSDYLATCKNGNRYHVFVNPQGRVVVQKL